MKKKGFTLIELLAVIVILAIIALIAIPLIGNVIEKAKIGALENSVNGLVESANMYYANQSIKGEQPTETIFDFANGEQTSTTKLEYKGKVYNGKLILHANGEAAVCIDDKEHYAYKNKDSDEIISGIGTCLYDGTTGDFSSNSPVEDLKKQVASATATSDKVLEGSTIYTLSGLVAGTMANNANKTLSATTVTESDDQNNALITIPSSGYYDETSKISVPIETIKNEVNSINSIISTAYGTYSYTTNGNINISKPSDFKNSTYTLLVYISEDYRATETLNVTGATLIKTLSGGRYGNYYDQKYMLYKVNSSTVTLNFTHGNSNAGIAYLLIDQELNDMSIVSDSVSYSSENKNKLFVSCNISDNRGRTFIDMESEKYIVHLQSGRNSVNYSSYYANTFIVYSLLENGNVNISRFSSNQYGNNLALS